MSHDHHHHHHASKNLGTAFFLNVGFTIIEIVGGIWTNSVAILADAIHDLGDSISLGIAWWLQKFSEKESNLKYTYGYGRFSLLGALVISLVLVAGSLVILSEAVPRLLAPETSNAPGMMLLAVIGIVVNGIAVLRLRGSENMNVKVVAWHLLEDVLGWVAVFVAGLLLLFIDLPIIDPILAVLFTLYVLFNVVKNLKKTLSLFLQRVPHSIDMQKLEQDLAAINGVSSTHHTHLWSLDGEHHVLTTHLVLESNTTREDIIRIKQAGKKLASDLHIQHLTIEVELEGEECGLAMQVKPEMQAKPAIHA